VSRTQFVRVCSIALWNTPDDVLDAACTAYKNAVVTAKNCSEHYWTNLAQWIDETSRLFIPGSFLICLFFLFGCEFYDDYGDFDLPTPAPMFEVGRDGIGLLRIASECFGVLQGASGCFGVLWSVSGCLGLLRIAHVRGGPRFLLICPPFSSTARRLSPR